MPPLYTSTNLTTLFRKVTSAARQVTASTNRTIGTASRLTRIQRARLSIKQALHEAFPSLRTPSYSLNTSLSGSARREFSQTAASHYQPPFSRAGQAFRGDATRHSGLTSRVGFGISPARTFASAPAGTIAANAPIFLRAFVKSLDLDTLHKDQQGPKPSLYTAFQPLHRSARLRRSRRKINCSQCSAVSSIHVKYSSRGSIASTDHTGSVDVARHHVLADLDHYFPRLLRSVEHGKLDLLLPEKLIQPGTTTVLTVGLSTSLRALLEPTTDISYRDAQLGLTVFANLFSGVIPLAEAFETYASSRVMPLIAKLESLGVINSEGSGPCTHLEYTTDVIGHIETLRFVFEGRSEGNVRSLLGETLLEEGQEVWFAIHEEKEVDAGSLTPEERMEMSDAWGSPLQEETRSITLGSEINDPEEIDSDMIEVWGSSPLPAGQAISPKPAFSDIDLILPSPDTFNGLHLSFEDDHNAVLSTSDSFSYPNSADFSPNRGNSTIPNSFSSYSTPSASFISSMVESERALSDGWSTAPSEADSDLDMEMNMSVDSLEDEIENDEREVEMQVNRGGSPTSDEEDRWRSTVRGSGLMQPW
jgi:hypothetical protein